MIYICGSTSELMDWTCVNRPLWRIDPTAHRDLYFILDNNEIIPPITKSDRVIILGDKNRFPLFIKYTRKWEIGYKV